MYVTWLLLISWTPRVWWCPRMHIFHSQHISSNFYQWHFVIRLQEFENRKWDAADAAADAVRTDRCEGWNSYVDITKNPSMQIEWKNFLNMYQLIFLHVDTLANLPQLLFFIQPDPADPAAPPVKGKFLGSLFGENNFQDVTPFLWKSWFMIELWPIGLLHNNRGSSIYDVRW